MLHSPELISSWKSSPISHDMPVSLPSRSRWARGIREKLRRRARPRRALRGGSRARRRRAYRGSCATRQNCARAGGSEVQIVGVWLDRGHAIRRFCSSRIAFGLIGLVPAKLVATGPCKSSCSHSMVTGTKAEPAPDCIPPAASRRSSSKLSSSRSRELCYSQEPNCWCFRRSHTGQVVIRTCEL